MIYTITLNPALDYFMAYPAPLSKWQVTSATQYLAGGKGIMAASHLQSINVPAVGIVVVGGIIGDKFAAALRSQLTRYELIRTTSETRINVKSNFAHQTVELNALGELVDGNLINDHLLKFLGAHLKPDDLVLIMGSLPPGYQDAHLNALAHFLTARRARLVFDLPDGALLYQMLTFRPEIVKPNRAELGAFFNTTLTNDEAVFACAKKLVAAGAQRVLVSLDKAGAIYVDEANEYTIAGVPIEEVNSAGAGDAMLAGFVAGLALALPLEETLKLAAASGTAKASSVGVATRTQVDDYVKLIKLHRRGNE